MRRGPGLIQGPQEFGRRPRDSRDMHSGLASSRCHLEGDGTPRCGSFELFQGRNTQKLSSIEPQSSLEM